MKIKTLNLLKVLYIFLLFSQMLFAQSNTQGKIEDKVAKFSDQQIHYLQSGSGSNTIILLHGWPESSFMWKETMFKLAGNYTVIAPDLRGVNNSSVPKNEFDKASLAEDIHKLVNYLNLKNVIVVGHDIGGMVTYAYVRLYPNEILGAAILDVPLPGLGSWDYLMKTEHVWHFRFHDQKPLAEDLVMGKQKNYFRYFIDSKSVNKSAIDDDAINAYAKAYNTKSSLNAGFEWYRAFPKDVTFNLAHKESLNVPVLLVGAEFSMKDALDGLKESLKTVGLINIETAVIMNSGHFIVEEKPEETAKIILDFVSKVKK